MLVERGLFPTRTKAQAAILAGQVRIGDRTEHKAGDRFAEDVAVELIAPLRYVGRGGLKLEAALDGFGVDPAGRVCLDVGASTGGFTDCLLQRGARKVYAVDVGYGQLEEKLRKDPRIKVMERTHARDLVPSMFPEPPDLGVVDVSFISLTKVLPPMVRCLKAPFDLVALIKPQFELGPKDVPRGIVQDDAARERAVRSVTEFADGQGLRTLGVRPSPVKGAKGNVEFLCHLRANS